MRELHDDHHASATLPSWDEAPAAARRIVREVLASAGHDHDVSEALLLVSELVTNAVVHTGSAVVDLDVSVAGSCLRCVVVDDAASEVPAVRPTGSAPVGGLGLVIVERVASRWGHDRRGDRKAVWFELDLD